MKNRVIIPAVVVVVILLGILFMVSRSSNIPSNLPNITSEENSCESMYDEIEKLLDDSNYCTNDSDCEPIMLGGPYIEFGCFHYINKNADKEAIYQKMEKYDQKCDRMIDKCKLAPPALCITGVCTSSNSIYQ